jgi:hypothetical protein
LARFKDRLARKGNDAIKLLFSNATPAEPAAHGRKNFVEGLPAANSLVVLRELRAWALCSLPRQEILTFQE